MLIDKVVAPCQCVGRTGATFSYYASLVMKVPDCALTLFSSPKFAPKDLV
jgi:hypothetical protein